LTPNAQNRQEIFNQTNHFLPLFPAGFLYSILSLRHSTLSVCTVAQQENQQQKAASGRSLIRTVLPS